MSSEKPRNDHSSQTDPRTGRNCFASYREGNQFKGKQFFSYPHARNIHRHPPCRPRLLHETVCDQ